jgi:hypothetical protein
MRTADLPPFLSELLANHLDTSPDLKCTSRGPDKDDDIDWCAGSEYIFLGPQGGHFRRSNYSERLVRPAADGQYPARKGKDFRMKMPVLVDVTETLPGRPLPPWPAPTPGIPYEPPRGRGRPRISEDARLASWLPILQGLSPHGLRHGHQTWMDEVGTSYILQSERMGHEAPGMRGVYGHISKRMRTGLVTALQGLWEESLDERAEIAPRSAVGVLDSLLTAGTPSPQEPEQRRE